MVIGILALGIVSGLLAGGVALAFGYSLLMALWFYVLFGTLTVLGAALSAYFVCPFLQKFWQNRHAYSE